MKRMIYISSLLLVILIGSCSKKSEIDLRLVGKWAVELPENTDYSFYHFEFTEDGSWSAEAEQKFGEYSLHDTVTTGFGYWKVKDKISDKQIEISLTRIILNISTEAEDLKKPDKESDWKEYAAYTIEFIGADEIKMGEIAMKEGSTNIKRFTVHLKRIY